MKKHIPWLVTAIAALLLLASIFRPEPAGERHWREFGRLPVILNGRTKPLDTVARTSLLVIHGKQTLREEGESPLPAIHWLAEVLFAPTQANARKVFTIHNPEIIGLFGWQRGSEETHFSFTELRPHFAQIDQQFRLAEPVEAKNRTQFQSHIIELYRHLVLYQRLKNTLQPEDAPDFGREIAAFRSTIGPGMQAMNQRDAGQPYDETVFNTFLSFASRYKDLGEAGYFLAIPPVDPGEVEVRSDWDKAGFSLGRTIATGDLHPVMSAYLDLGTAFRAGDTAAFNTALTGLTAWLDTSYAPEMKKVAHETGFNRVQPFYQAMVLYVAVFVLTAISWLFPAGVLGRTAIALGILALVVHTAGLAFRVYLQNYPPVTNLYSAAVVVGWGAAVIGLIVELLFRNGVGLAVKAVVGFCSLLLAHHLSLSGDTMEMMQAVLDSNFWLSVHVPTIVLGYSATFAAGAVGLFFIVLGLTTRILQPRFSKSLYNAAYGIICFATFLSFVGTVLGGIWADQSWGRFWGWDPKENGAALIVVWNAIMLHSRWAGYVRERGFMQMAIFGNIVTAWSFFGTNLLGVGLHSYGFTSEGAIWLWGFMFSQVLFIAIGWIPLRFWVSPMTRPPTPQPGSAGPPPNLARQGSAGS